MTWNARVIQVIETELELRGKGAEGDPYRRVRQFWTLEGKLLAEVDPCVHAHEPGCCSVTRAGAQDGSVP